MTSEQVTVRPYEPNDRGGFLSLYRTVWGRRKGREWFRWRFEENPYRDGVRMIVAEAGGEIVGVEPLLPFRLRAGPTTLDVHQPVDWLVHPDYRRQGVFSRMTEALLREYGDDAAALFNFPNDALLPGLEKHGWREVGDVPARYRVNDLRRLSTECAGVGDSTASGTALSVGGAVTGRLLELLDRTADGADGVSVERRDGVPVGPLADLYASNVPERFHLARDEDYLGWRFSNPRWETTTYLASRGGGPVAAVVTATEELDGFVCTHLLDVQPMRPDDDRTDALRAILAEVVADHDDVDVVKAPSGLHSRLFRRFGFLTDTAFPLSRVTTTTTHAVRPLTDDPGTDPAEADGAWRVDGRDLADPDEWILTPADLDIE